MMVIVAKMKHSIVMVAAVVVGSASRIGSSHNGGDGGVKKAIMGEGVVRIERNCDGMCGVGWR